MPKIYEYNHPFALENGETLPSLTIAYDTFGTLNTDKSNAVWVCHALTANSDVANWWPHTVEADKFLDPSKYFTICANFLGSCYGTTGPTSTNPLTGEKWHMKFPRITVRDMVHAHQLLAEHLGITHVKMLIGASIGGFQALEWSVMQPSFAENAIFIATAPSLTPWICAFNESQRMAIEADCTWGDPIDNAGEKGMAAARSLALLSYRGCEGYNLSQADNGDEELFHHRVQTYQQHQGEKLKQRFNAYSYYRISESVDSHDLGRGRGGVKKALESINAKCLIVAISSDNLFPPKDLEIMHRYISQNEYHIIESPFAHDGFLVEHEQLNKIIKDFIDE